LVKPKGLGGDGADYFQLLTKRREIQKGPEYQTGKTLLELISIFHEQGVAVLGAAPKRSAVSFQIVALAFEWMKATNLSRIF
jgi:hypothetical protein